MEFFGGVMVSGKPVSFGGVNRSGSSNDYFSAGTITIEEFTLRMTSDGQIRFDNNEAAIANISNIRFHGNGNILLFSEGYTTFSAIFDNVILQSFAGQLAALRFDDLFLLNNQAIADTQANRGGEVFIFRNSDKGSSTRVIHKNNNDFHLAFFGTALIEALDQDGTALEDIKYRIVDTVGNNRVAPIGTFTTDFPELAAPYGVSAATVYEGTTDADGKAAPVILMSTYSADSNESTRRSDYSNGESLGDSFEIKMFGYGIVYSSQSAVLRTRGGTPVRFFLEADEARSEADKALVNAYTELDTSAKMYDRLKAYLDDNWAGEADLFAIKVVDQLDFGSRDVTLQPTGDDVVSIANDGSITLVSGPRFTGSIITTGSVTLLNDDVDVVGSVHDSNGVRVAISGLPAGHEAVAAAWPSADGLSSRDNIITGRIPRVRRRDISMTAATRTIYSVGGSFDGFRTGDDVHILHFDEANNNGIFAIESISDDHHSLVLIRDDGESFVDEAAGNDIVVIDDTTTTIPLQLAANTEYYVMSDAVSYIRSRPILLDTTTLSSLNISLSRITDALGMDFIVQEEDLTDLQREEFFLIEYDHDNDRVIVGGTDTVQNFEFPAVARAIELGQSSDQGQSDPYVFHFSIGSLSLEAGSGRKIIRKSGLAVDIVPDLSSMQMRKLGSGEVKDITDFSNGAIIVNTGVPAIVALEGVAESDFHGYLDEYGGKDDYKSDPLSVIGASIFGGDFVGRWEAGIFAVDNVVWYSDKFYKCTAVRTAVNTDNPATDTTSWEVARVEAGSGGGSGSLDQTTFNTRMANVPDDTKDTYKGSGGNGGGTIDQDTFNTRMMAVPDTTKGEYRADVSSLPTNMPTAADIASRVVSDLQAADFDEGSGTDTLLQVLAALGTAIAAIPTDTVPTVAQIVTGIFAADTDSTTAGTQTLHDRLVALKTVIDALPTSSPSAADIAATVAAPSVASIVTGLQEADMSSSGGVQTLAVMLDAIRTAAEANKAALEHSTSGLPAIKTAVDNVPTDAAPTADSIVSAIQSADFEEGGGTQTLLQVLELLRTSVAAIPTDNPSALDIIAALQTADFEEGGGTNTLLQVLASIQSAVDDSNSHLENTNYGLVPLKALLDAIPTSNPTAAQIVAAIQMADFEEGSGTDTLLQVLANIVNLMSQGAFDARMLAVPDTTKDTYKGSGSGTGTTIDQSTFNARMAAVPGATKDQYKADASVFPTVAQIVAGIQTADFEEGTGTDNILQVLASIKLSVDSIPTSNPSSSDIISALQTADFSAEAGAQTLADVLAAIKAVVDANESHLESASYGLARNIEITLLAVGAVAFGGRFQGAWAAGDFAVDDVAWFDGLFYECTDGRNAANSDNPATDTASWMPLDIRLDQDKFDSLMSGIPTATKDTYKGSVDQSQSTFDARMAAVPEVTKSAYRADVSLLSDGTDGLAALRASISTIPTAAQIVAAIQTADFEESSGTNTLLQVLAAIKSAVDDSNSHLENTNYGLAALATFNMIGASIFGRYFKGVWAAGTFIKDEVVWHSAKFYQCTVGRASTDTDNPVVDTNSWEVTISPLIDQDTFDLRMAAVPNVIKDRYKGAGATAAGIAAAVEGSAVGTNVVAIKDAVENTSFGLSALKILIDTVDAVVDSIKSLVEDPASGLAAIKTQGNAIEGYADILDDAANGLVAVRTLIAAIPTTATPTAAHIVAAIQAADFEDGSGTNTLLHVLAGIGTAVQAIPTSNPSSADIVAAIRTADFGTGSAETGTQTLEGLLDGIRTVLDAIRATNPDVANIVAGVVESNVGTGISAVRDAVENSTSGLPAIKTLLDTIPTSNPSAADLVAAIQMADFEEGSGTHTLLQVLSGIQTSIGSIPTDNASSSVADAVLALDIVTGVSLLKAIQVLLSGMIGKVTPRGSDLDLYTPIDDTHVATVPKSDDGESRPLGATIE